MLEVQLYVSDPQGLDKKRAPVFMDLKVTLIPKYIISRWIFWPIWL